MEKPNSFSVTGEPCRCRTLETQSKRPRSAISFDKEVNEYGILSPDGSTMVVYHCPFCGGAAPKSIRDTLFHDISDSERSRLTSLTEGIETVQDALRILGYPNQDLKDGSRALYPESKDRGPTEHGFRCLIYSELSDTVEVRITEYPNKAFVALSGKYRGKRDA